MQRTDSIVHETGGVIVKQHRADGPARARHEFAALAMLRDAMPPAYTVPRAIQLDEAKGSLVMERAGGTPLDVTIREGKRQRDAIARLAIPLRRAGEWLRAMQQATMWRAEAAPPLSDRAALPPHSKILAEQVAKAVRDAESSRLRDVIPRLRELERRGAPRIACGHHGDYWPGNIFLDETRATVIDFEGYRDGLPLEDVAYFLIELELLLPRHARHLPALRAAFVEGYGGIDDPDALQLFTLTKALHLIARDAGSQQPWLIAMWTRRTLRDIVRRCLPA